MRNSSRKAKIIHFTPKGSKAKQSMKEWFLDYIDKDDSDEKVIEAIAVLNARSMAMEATTDGTEMLEQVIEVTGALYKLMAYRPKLLEKIYEETII